MYKITENFSINDYRKMHKGNIICLSSEYLIVQYQLYTSMFVCPFNEFDKHSGCVKFVVITLSRKAVARQNSETASQCMFDC